MRLLCLADLQIGAGADFGRSPYGPGSRLADQQRMLGDVARLARDEQVDAVVIAGDVFHRRPYPRPEELLVFQRFLADIDCETLAIVGNHDIVGETAPCALDLFCESGQLELHRAPDVRRLGPVGFAFLPWVSDARLVSARDGGSREERNREMAELLLTIARGLADALPPGVPKVLVAHWAVSGGWLPVGIPTDRLAEPVLPLHDLAACGFDAIILGHIHAGQVLLCPDDADEPGLPLVVYVGSPWICDFGEANIGHHVLVLDTDPVSSRFVTIDDRPFVTIDRDVTGRLAPEGWGDLTDAVVRLRYRCTEEQAQRISRADVERSLLDAGAHVVYQVVADVARGQRARVEGLDEAMGPMEALEFALARDEEAQPYEDEIRALTASYLREVDQ